MRAAVTSVAGLFVVSVLTACGAVPDLRFGDGDDGGSPVVLPDATIPTTTPLPADGSMPPKGDDDSSSPVPGDDASGDDAGAPVDSAPPIVDANLPHEASTPTVCPNHPPFGVSCCGTMECRPNGFVACDCTACQSHCTANQACCIDKNSQFQQCADSINDCPKP